MKKHKSKEYEKEHENCLYSVSLRSTYATFMSIWRNQQNHIMVNGLLERPLRATRNRPLSVSLSAAIIRTQYIQLFVYVARRHRDSNQMSYGVFHASWWATLQSSILWIRLIVFIIVHIGRTLVGLIKKKKKFHQPSQSIFFWNSLIYFVRMPITLWKIERPASIFFNILAPHPCIFVNLIIKTFYRTILNLPFDTVPGPIKIIQKIQQKYHHPRFLSKHR